MQTKIVKICKKHGELTMEQIREERTSKGYKTYRCYLCKIEKDRRWKENNREQHIEASKRWKVNNREKYNEWNKKDRQLYPEKHRRYKFNAIANKGITEHRLYEVLRIHGLTKEEHVSMLEMQKNLCAICMEPEKRLSRNGETITPLCIDHCHECRKNNKKDIRGLLCHKCNTALGKFKDDIGLLKSAIAYLEKHQCHKVS